MRDERKAEGPGAFSSPVSLYSSDERRASSPTMFNTFSSRAGRMEDILKRRDHFDCSFLSLNGKEEETDAVNSDQRAKTRMG